jgi:hypothetical protein
MLVKTRISYIEALVVSIITESNEVNTILPRTCKLICKLIEL